MNQRRSLFFALCALFFSSGATALIYEVLWLRGFSIVLGSTVYSMSCVLTAFMAGLALGSTVATRVLGRMKVKGPGTYVRIYGVLELVIGLYGLAFTPALFLGQERWLALVGHFQDSTALVALLVHFAFSFVALLIPTFCMGATLPILVMGLEKDRDTVGLYGFNTFGAAVGSVVASFVLIYFFGVITSTFIVTAVNVSIFAVALWLAGRVSSAPDEGPVPSSVEAPVSTAPDVNGAWSPTILLALAFLSGLLFFAFELVWNRVLSIVLGNRVYVMSITLATVLVCLGLGARLCRNLLHTHKPEKILVGSYTFAAIALCLGLLAQVGGLQQRNPGLLMVFLVFGIPLPAIAMGIVFPLLLTLPARGVLRGVHVGRLYAVNTLGAMAGSLLTGYVLFGAIGSNRILLLGMAVMLLSVALLAFGSGGALRVSKPVAAVAVVALLIAAGVRWNTRLSTIPEKDALVVDEDAYGIFSIARDTDGYLSVRCNRTELVFLFGHPLTQYVQESQAHLPLFFAKKRDNVLVVGSGYGITAGAASTWPDVKRVDAVEILPLMVSHADQFKSGNFDYHHNPKVKVHVADGRHFLAASPIQYDVVSINVSDPYLPGSSSLFSSEFYDLVTRTLAPGGIVCQHIFGPDAASLYHGFKQHFRYVKVIPAYENGVSVLGSQEPLDLQGPDAFADKTLSGVLRDIGISDREKLTQLLLEGDARQKTLEAEPAVFLNSDVNPALEFRRSDKVRLLYSNF